MKLKIQILLIPPLIVSALLIIYYGKNILTTFQYVGDSIQVDVEFIIVVSLAIGLQMAGHLLRSKKAVLLFSPIERSKVSTQLRAFGVGQLFNNLLPLKLGEFVRAAILSQKLNISYLYTFSLVIFERALDLICISAGVLIGIMLITNNVSAGVVVVLSSLLILGLGAVWLLLILRNPPVWLLRSVYFATKIFNPHLKNLIRFKIWSLSYGLGESLSMNILKKYIVVTCLMWMTYLFSIYLLCVELLDGTDWLEKVVAAFAPYIGMATPAGPAGLGVFSDGVRSITSLMTDSNVVVFAIIAWAVVLLPISIVGLISIPKTTEPIWKKRRKGASDNSLANKLIRNEDVSGELEHFLEGYFKGNPPSLIVNRLERGNELRLVKYFRGGSDAITILALHNKKRVVKKIIPINLKDRLKAQYDWLQMYTNNTIVSASNEKTAADYYSIDIKYDSTSVSMYDYVHEIPLRVAQDLLAEAWTSLNNTVYGSGVEVSDPGVVDAYIDKHIHRCVSVASETDPVISQAMKTDKVVINGIEYDNLHQILDKIKADPVAWHDICTYQSTGVVHGDMILDNLLYSHSDKKVIIIDPAPDGNIIEGPVFDFGKAAQSLHCGYEFLLRDESLVELSGNEIVFNENKSLRYSELDIFMRDTLAKKYLTEGERKAILFHAGVLCLRRLKHQVHYTPDNALKFYAVGVRTLNHFFAQYESSR